MPEQRKNQRFDLQLPLKVIKAGSKALAVAAQTRNISSSGVLFSCDSDVDVGESIEYVLALPTKSPNSEKVNLRCVGKVVRFEPPANAFDSQGVAATLERYEFVRERDAQ